jgi:hypothetical protein
MGNFLSRLALLPVLAAILFICYIISIILLALMIDVCCVSYTVLPKAFGLSYVQHGCVFDPYFHTPGAYWYTLIYILYPFICGVLLLYAWQKWININFAWIIKFLICLFLSALWCLIIFKIIGGIASLLIIDRLDFNFFLSDLPLVLPRMNIPALFTFTMKNPFLNNFYLAEVLSEPFYTISLPIVLFFWGYWWTKHSSKSLPTISKLFVCPFLIFLITSEIIDLCNITLFDFSSSTADKNFNVTFSILGAIIFFFITQVIVSLPVNIVQAVKDFVNAGSQQRTKEHLDTVQ